MAFESDKKIKLPKEVPEKLPEAASLGATPYPHMVHMRGLSFHTNTQDVINFFVPLKLVQITVEYSFSGKITGKANVHFDSHEDTVVVMLKDWSLVHYRNIELFLNFCAEANKTSGVSDNKGEDKNILFAHVSWMCDGKFQFIGNSYYRKSFEVFWLITSKISVQWTE